MTLSFSIPTLETQRLHLRAWRNEDLDAFAEFCANETTARFVGGACNREDAWRRIAGQVGHWALRKYGSWALEEKASNRWIGYCGLWNPEGWPECEVMWGLEAAAHGKGYATEAAKRSRDFAYEQLGWTTLISCIAPENSPSQRVAARLGAKRERMMELRGSAIGIYRHPGPEQLNS